MFIINFSVKDQNLKLETDLRKAHVTSDTINYFKCQFKFNEAWDGFEKRAYFKNASFNITKSALLDGMGYCYIPWEVLAHTGVILCNVVGTKYEDGLSQRITAGPIKLFLHNFGSEEQLIKRIEDGKATIDPLSVFVQKEESPIEPDYQADLTPTEYEQYVGEIKQYSDSAKEIEEKIRNLTASIIMEEVGTEAYVSKIDKGSFYDLEFHIPESEGGGDGTYNYNELQNRPSIEGVTLEGDKLFPELNLNYLSNWEIENLLN